MNQKDPITIALRKKKIRIFSLLILLGLVFWGWGAQFYSPRQEIAPLASVGGDFSLSPLSPGFGFSGPGGYRNPLLDYPDPARMRTFSYRLGLYTDKTRLLIKDICADEYYAILIYRKGDDYRVQPNAALYNSAQLCASGKRFVVEIDLMGVLRDTPGSYYYFVADQGKVGEWRNPR